MLGEFTPGRCRAELAVRLKSFNTVPPMSAILVFPILEPTVKSSRVEVERMLNETRSQGFGIFHRQRRISEETSLSIPLRAKDRILATLTVRYAASAVTLRTAVEKFLPKFVVEFNQGAVSG